MSLLAAISVGLSIFSSTLTIAEPATLSSQEEFATVNGVIVALYDVISGPKDKKRDEARLRSLFSPKASMAAISLARPDAAPRTVTFTVDEYISRNIPFMEREGFFEKELGRKVETFGNIAHVWTGFETRMGTADAKPMARGINSVQLTYDGKRWFILSILWDNESPKNLLPKDMDGSG